MNVPNHKNIRFVIINIILILIIITIFFWWIFYYTDWFMVASSFFTITGILAWAVFLFNILEEARADALRILLDEKVLQKGKWSIVFGLVLSAFVTFVWLGQGSVEFDTHLDEKNRVVKVYEIIDGTRREIDRASLTTRSTTKMSFWTGLFGNKEIVVKANGLPWHDVTVKWAGRTKIIFPKDLRERSIVLVRPSLKDLVTFSKSPNRYVLEIFLGKESEQFYPYGGEAILIGADNDVEFSQSIIEAWKNEAQNLKVPINLALRWTSPKTFREYFALPPESKIRSVIRLKNNPNKILAEAHLNLPRSGSIKSFPIELVVLSAVN